MSVFFGTDGYRGVFGESMTPEIAIRMGRALGSIKKNAKIILGRDTRFSGELLSQAFSLGAINSGAAVFDVGVCPTAGVAYLTMLKKCDFGVVISASHNAAEFNGIKIFNNRGEKIGDDGEREIESLLLRSLFDCSKAEYGHYKQVDFVKNYFDFLLKNGADLSGLKIVLDCANGASFLLAPKVFKKLGAEVNVIKDNPDGKNINDHCGATDLTALKYEVVKSKADVGFAFDGDSDRVMAVDENGDVVDGDMMLYLFATKYLEDGKLKKNCVVGTSMTNAGTQEALRELGITLIRADVGDKFVNQELEKNGLMIGGEQCGHLFLKDILPTGDGILNAIKVSEIIKNSKGSFSSNFNYKNYFQLKIDIMVKNKIKVLKCKKMLNLIKNIQNEYKNNIRVLVRFSGTEPKIRLLVEGKNNEKMKEIALKIEEEIKIIDKEIC